MHTFGMEYLHLEWNGMSTFVMSTHDSVWCRPLSTHDSVWCRPLSTHDSVICAMISVLFEPPAVMTRLNTAGNGQPEKSKLHLLSRPQ